MTVGRFTELVRAAAEGLGLGIQLNMCLQSNCGLQVFADCDSRQTTEPSAQIRSMSKQSCLSSETDHHLSEMESTSKKPTVLLMIGMAGSGKTTLIQRLVTELHQRQKPSYFINMDPAVSNIPYHPNVDIRDTVKYKEIMRQYQLGPNGAILTSCNLFATKFDQVIQLCEKERSPPLEYIVVDTPGQIEVFTWSASGSIVTEIFASSFPTIVVFVVDTVRCVQPKTFMSNMLQACSILYKTRLPLLLAFNKTDEQNHEFALEWMKNFEEYENAMKSDSSYSASLSKSMALVLEEFYENLHNVGVSAVTAAGMDEFFECVQKCVDEYEVYYRPELEKMKKEEIEKEIQRQKDQIEKMRLDSDPPGPGSGSPSNIQERK